MKSIDDAPPRAALSAYPTWLRITVLLILLSCLTQVTLRHLALRLAGVRTGEITEVQGGPDGEAVLQDPFAVFPPDALAGDGLWIGDERFEVKAHTTTSITLAANVAEVQPLVEGKTRYVTGVVEQGLLTRLALAVPGVNATLSDLLLGIGCLLLAAWLLIKRQLVTVLRSPAWLPPWTLLVFAGICLLSLRLWARGDPQAPNLASGIKELIQYGEVLIVGFAFFLLAWRDEWLRRRLLPVLGAGAGLLIVVGLVEYVMIMRGGTLRGLADLGELDSLLGFRFNPERSGVAGSEAGKNMLAAYLLVLLPVLAALGLSPLRWPWRVAAWLGVALGLVLILHPLHLAIALLSITIVAGTLCTARWIVPAVLGGGLLVVIMVGVLNAHHGKVLMDAVAMHKYADPYGLLPMPLKGERSNTALRWMLWQQKVAEVQAAVNAVGLAPFLGHGVGNYQERINATYTNGPLWHLAVPKESGNFMERDAHGQFLVTAVETGVLGLGALLIFLATQLHRAYQARRRLLGSDRNRWDCLLLASVAGVVVSLLLAGWLLPFLVRGLHILIVALLALPLALDHEPEA